MERTTCRHFLLYPLLFGQPWGVSTCALLPRAAIYDEKTTYELDEDCKYYNIQLICMGRLILF